MQNETGSSQNVASTMIKSSWLFKVVRVFFVIVVLLVAAATIGAWGWFLAHAVIATWPTPFFGQALLTLGGWVIWVAGFVAVAVVATEMSLHCYKSHG